MQIYDREIIRYSDIVGNQYLLYQVHDKIALISNNVGINNNNIPTMSTWTITIARHNVRKEKEMEKKGKMKPLSAIPVLSYYFVSHKHRTAYG